MRPRACEAGRADSQLPRNDPGRPRWRERLDTSVHRAATSISFKRVFAPLIALTNVPGHMPLLIPFDHTVDPIHACALPKLLRVSALAIVFSGIPHSADGPSRCRRSRSAGAASSRVVIRKPDNTGRCPEPGSRWGSTRSDECRGRPSPRSTHGANGGPRTRSPGITCFPAGQLLYKYVTARWEQRYRLLCSNS